MLTYLLLRAGGVVSHYIPAPTLYRVAGAVGTLISLMPTAARAAARANIARAMGLGANDPAVRHAAASALRTQALNYVDLLRMSHPTRDELDRRVVCNDLGPLANAANGGMILLSAHLGNVDYAIQWLAVRGYTVHAPMERLHPPLLHRWVVRQRSRAGLHIHVLGDSVMGELTRALRAGEIVAIIGDRDLDGSGQTVPFFGTPTVLPVGPALLALRTGAPIVPAFAHRLADNRIAVTIGEPLWLPRETQIREDIRRGMQIVTETLERGIAACPEQWVVFSPVWPHGDARGERAA